MAVECAQVERTATANSAVLAAHRSRWPARIGDSRLDYAAEEVFPPLSTLARLAVCCRPHLTLRLNGKMRLQGWMDV